MIVFHVDMNFAAFRMEALQRILEQAAASGADTILWEIEDKVRLDALGQSVHPDAMSKRDFRTLLAYAKSLHLCSIPLLQTLGHAEYVLKTPDHSAWREAGFPDCYCTSQPAVLEFLENMVLEIADLFDNPAYFHLGGDEAYHYQCCEACQKRDRVKMFCEHEEHLSALLEARNIRPCLWADMLLNHEEIRRDFSRKFCIWLWNYGATTWWGGEAELRDAGYDVVICPASASSGDSPFLPRWDLHADNIAGAAYLMKKDSLLGMSLTSWSVRLGLKQTQTPLWQVGKKVFADGMTAADAKREVARHYFGDADPNAFGNWDPVLAKLTGVMWTPYKDGLPPPAGLFEQRLREFAEELKPMPKTLTEWIAHAERAAAQFPVKDEISTQIARGAELRLNFMRALQNLLTGHSFPTELLERDRQAFADYLMLEQTPGSARHNAALVYNPICEYSRKVQER